MSDMRNFRIARDGIIYAKPEEKTGFSLHFVGVQGNWLVVIWTREIEYQMQPGDKYKETETVFYNQQGEIIATYFESTLSQRKVADEPPAQKP